MKEIVLRGGEVQSMAEVHGIFAAALHFPDWYGGTLDALYDFLTALRVDTRIVLKNEELLREALGARYRALCRMLQDSAEENEHIVIIRAGE